MKLHRVQLRNYRGVAESSVSFSEEGVTIVEGPNEVGKTAIAEGLQLAIDLPDSSKHSRVKAVKPVDRDEGPEVEISLSSGRYEVVYRKRWLYRPATTLEVKAPIPENWTGKDAHDRLKAILGETLDDDLWRALRIEQGTELALPGFGLPSMSRALDYAAGGDIATDREETLWNRITEEYDRYWTPTGQVRAERRASEQRVNQARDKVVNLEGELLEIESDTIEMSRLVEESSRLSATLKECEEREREFTGKSNEIYRLRSEVERLDAIHSASKAQRDKAASNWQGRQNLIDNLDTSTRKLAELESEAEAAAPGLEAATRRREETAAALKDADGEVRGSRARQDRAIADRDYLRQLIEVEQLRERHERYLAAEESLKQAEIYLESARVDDEVAKNIEEAYIEDERAKAAAGSAAASVEVTSLRKITMRVGDKNIELAVNETHPALVEDELILTIPDIARIRVNAGPESKDLAEQRRKAQETYRLLCEGAGVSDCAGARRAAQERQDAQRNKNEAVQAIERELRDLTPDVLIGKVKSLTERITSYPGERSENPPLPLNLDEGQRIEAEVSALVRDREAKLLAFEADSQDAEKKLTEALKDEAGRTARIEVARANKSDVASQLARDREAQSDESLIADVAAAQEREARDQKLLEDAQVQLSDADPDSVAALLENAKKSRERATVESQSNRDHQNALRTSLDLRGEQGLQSTYDEAESHLNHAEREHERQEARAESARLLKETFQKHRDQAHQRYIEPFKNCIDQLGRIVFGATFGVELDRNLQVKRRTLDGATLDVDQLSTGAREQLGVITRLACAIIVSPDDGGAPVMIDDALGWSDPQRLQGMGAAIAAAGKQCQVVVLTCTPGRYSHVGSAKVVSLSKRLDPHDASSQA